MALSFLETLRAESAAQAAAVMPLLPLGQPGYATILADLLPRRAPWPERVAGLSAERELAEAQEALSRLLLRPELIEQALAEAERAAGEPRTKTEIVEAAMRAGEMLEFSYADKWGPRAGVPQSFSVEPYEVSRHPASGRPVLYAYHPAHDEIHAFLWERIQAPVAVAGSRFTPRWPVQPESVERV